MEIRRVPAVSVLIPAWNCADLLERALRSVAAQATGADMPLEVIVVDDGSSDDTGERAARVARELPVPVRCVRQDNAGPAAARNHALSLARGELVAFLDADDEWAPDKLARQVPLFARERVGLVYCDVAFVDAQGRPLERYARRVRLVEGDILLDLFQDFFLLTSAVVMRRELAEREGGFRVELPVGEDYDFFLRVLRHCEAGVVRAPLLRRTVRPDSLSRQDFALDARVDIDTLRRFVAGNPAFAAAHPAAIAERIARYHGLFAWELLGRGRRRDAITQSLESLRARTNLPALKTLVRAFLP
jgi:glycosyltransferase involved in cell wall biosynthesis